MKKVIPAGARPLSTYPTQKIRVTCAKCGLDVRYDRDELLAAGGDRGLTFLLDDIAKRHGCKLVAGSGRADIYDRCLARYSELVALDKAGQ